jgi:rhodanese-related sulfurtransferase
MTVSAKMLVEEALSRIAELSPAEVMAERERDPGSLQLVDVRDIREIEREGRIPGAFHCPRGMLEFWIDPKSPYHKPIFAEPKRFVFYCSLGWRSALSTDTAQRMGLANVAHIEGGFAAWKAAGGAVDFPTPKT